MSAASTETSAPLPTAGSRVFFQGATGVGCAGAGPIAGDDPVQKRQGKVTVKYDRKELRKRLVLEEWIIEQLSELYDCEVSGAPVADASWKPHGDRCGDAAAGFLVSPFDWPMAENNLLSNLDWVIAMCRQLSLCLMHHLQFTLSASARAAAFLLSSVIFTCSNGPQHPPPNSPAPFGLAVCLCPLHH